MTLVVERVADDVLRLRMHNWQGRAVGYEVSAYLVRGVLVDSGFPRVRRELLAAVATHAPRGAILTHWHEDHAGNAAALADAGLPLRMHPGSAAMLRAHPRIGLYRRVVWGRADRLTSPLLDFDPAPLELLETPGHTPDHIIVWDAERRVVVSGDLFLGVKVRVAHVHESPRRLVSSLRRVAALEPTLLLDAHRGPVHEPVTMLAAKIAWMEETIGAIETLASAGVGEAEIQRRVLGREAFVGFASAREYSKRSFVRAVLHELALSEGDHAAVTSTG